MNEKPVFGFVSYVLNKKPKNAVLAIYTEAWYKKRYLVSVWIARE